MGWRAWGKYHNRRDGTSAHSHSDGLDERLVIDAGRLLFDSYPVLVERHEFAFEEGPVAFQGAKATVRTTLTTPVRALKVKKHAIAVGCGTSNVGAS